jgi:propanol-preferring alcohol dehydrogenase
MDGTMTETMLAVRQLAWESRPELVTVPVPTPAPGEVLVKVRAAGVCHSDLHVMHAPGGQPGFAIPFTLGHEVAGTVVEVGAGGLAYRRGDTVAVYGIWSCGSCARCLAGRENYCPHRGAAPGGGLGRDGGLAEYMLVPSERFLVPLDGLDPIVAAPLTDAGLTSYHAINRSRDRLRAGAVVAVIGIGGLGHLALQILRATSAATAIAIDPKSDALDLALRCGATEVASSAVEAHHLVKQVSEGVGADLVLDFVGAQSTLDLAAELVAVDGDLTIVGSAGGLLKAGKTSGLPVGCRISAPFWGSRPELSQVLQLAQRGFLGPEIEQYPLTSALDVYERLEAGRISGRGVIVPAAA